MPTTFLATLGAEPQVVTITLDLLRARGIYPRRVVVLHSDPDVPPTREALAALRTDGLSFEGVPLLHDGQPLDDIRDESEARAAFRVIYSALETEKSAGQTVHFSAAGGRKAMAMYAMLAAQLLFEEADRLWNLVSGDPLRESRALHAGPGEAALLRVPVLPWRIELTRKRAFIERDLTPAERDLLALAVVEGLTNAAIAVRRGVSEKTVTNQFTAIYDKLRAAYPASDGVDRHLLMAEFGPYFQVIEMLDADE